MSVVRPSVCQLSFAVSTLQVEATVLKQVLIKLAYNVYSIKISSIYKKRVKDVVIAL